MGIGAALLSLSYFILAAAAAGAGQGLTLVHFSAQRKRILLNRGYI
jgi:hypothetical protein